MVDGGGAVVIDDAAFPKWVGGVEDLQTKFEVYYSIELPELKSLGWAEPPSGPPNSIYFSRRKLAEPDPPLPALI